LLVVLLASGCGDHEPVVERRGEPTPDGTIPNPACTNEGSGGEGGAAPAPIRFCQAEIVLRTVCQRCHTEPPLNGAPFPLITYADTQQPFDAGKRRWERMREVVESGFMPLRSSRLDPPVVPLTCEEKATLLGWLAECARPVGGTLCADEETLVSCD
jgi:hypothetical protein